MKTKLKWIAVAVAIVFIGLQFTSPQRINPPFDETQTLQALNNVPPDISNIFTRSCNDCHSNQTNWRWYTNIAPVSWFTARHVNDGRAELNFSEWGTYNERTKETRLAAICELVKEGDMPLPSYLWAHPESKLTPQEVKMICDWSREINKSNARLLE